MSCKSSSLYPISGSVMIVGLKIIHTSLEHYTTGIFPNVFSSFWHICHFSHTSILKRQALLTRKVAGHTARCTPVIGGGIQEIIFLLEWCLYQSFVYPTRLTWTIFLVLSIRSSDISQLIILEPILASQLESTPGFSLVSFHVPQKVPNILTTHDIPQLQLCCPDSGILI